MPIGSVSFSCARGRGCYVEIFSGDPFEVDFDVFGVTFGPVAFPAALALFFREKGAPGLGSGTRACVIPTQSLCGTHTVWVCVGAGGTRKV